MYYRVEKNLKDFEFWGGARDRALLFTDEEFEIIEQYLEDVSMDITYTETDINDFVWFEDEFYITELFGYEDVDDFYKERGNR